MTVNERVARLSAQYSTKVKLSQIIYMRYLEKIMCPEKWYATVPLVVYFYHKMTHRTRQNKYEKKLQENEAELTGLPGHKSNSLIR